METSAFLQKFETLTHAERVKQMVEYGKTSNKNPSIKEFITTFSSASLYQQALSLESCYGSHDISIAVRLVQSPSKHLKKRAISIILLMGSDEDVLQAIQSVPAYLQIRAVRRLRNIRRGRRGPGVIEKFLQNIENSPADRNLFRKLFSLGSKEMVERNLPHLEAKFVAEDWTRLIRYHPDVAEAAIRAWALRVEDNNFELGEIIEAQFPLWISYPSAIDAVLKLVKDLLPKIPIDRFPIEKMVSKRPKETVQIILDCKDDLEETVVTSLDTKVLRKLPVESFLPLIKRYPQIFASSRLELLLPEQRMLVYEEFGEGRKDKHGVMDAATIACLPEKYRVLEARRHLKLKRFEAHLDRKIPYIAFLPWEEAIVLQMPFLQDSDADTRGIALREQIGAARWDGDRLSNALQLILQRKNEQDPVKRQMVTGLQEIPVGRWREEHLEDFAQVIRNMLDASDASSGTISALLDIVTDLLPSFPAWSTAQLQIMTRDRSEIPTWRRPSGKAPVIQTMQAVASALSPLIRRLYINNDASTLWNLSSSFGKHTKHWTALLDTCEQTLGVHEMANWRSYIVAVLKEHRPLLWPRIIPALIAENAQSSGIPELLKYVHARQQNLLWDNYIETENWWTKEAVRKLTGGFWRWTEKQQQGLQKTLLQEIGEGEKEQVEGDGAVEKKPEENVKAVKLLGLLTFCETDGLVKIATDKSRSVLMETAIHVLGDLDDDRGAATLIDALSDSRARFAIYSLRGILKNMSKAATLELLKSVPKDKVTVRKETLRLIGELETEEAFTYLVAVSRETDLHRDVRIALLRSFWSFLDRDETWTLFEDAATSEEVAVAKGAADIPTDRIERLNRSRLPNLSLILSQHKEASVRVHALDRCAEANLLDPDSILVPRLLELIHSPIPDEAAAAAKAIFATYGRGENIEIISALYKTLIADQKLLRKVHDDVYLDLVTPEDSDKHTRPTTHAILAVLATDRLSIGRRVKTLFVALPWVEIKPYFLAMLKEGRMHADALVQATGFLEAERHQMWWQVTREARWRKSSDETDLRETLAVLCKDTDERARRVALSLLVGVAKAGEKGWGLQDREVLEVLRADESPMVGEAAWAVEVGELEVDGEGEEEGDEDEDEDSEVEEEDDDGEEALDGIH